MWDTLLLSSFDKWENEALRWENKVQEQSGIQEQNSVTQEWEPLKIILYAIDMYLQINQFLIVGFLTEKDQTMTTSS